MMISNPYSQYIIDQGFDETDIADSDLGRTLYIHSLAVNSEGRGFISFTIRNAVEYDTSFFGVIQVSNVNAVIDCQTTVLGYQEEHEISFTVSTGYDSSEDGEEKLYGNLIFAQSLNHINAEPGSYWHEEPIPCRLFEINLENLVEINPIMVNHGLTLSELTQDNNGQ